MSNDDDSRKSTLPQTSAIRRKRFAVFVVLGALLLAFGAWRLLREPEPRHEDRRLSSWLVEMDSLAWGETNAPVVHALRSMGTNAVPYLVRDILERDPSWVVRWRQRLIIRGYGRLPGTPASTTRRRAARALEILGPDSAPAFPLLLGVVKETQGENGLPWIGISVLLENVEGTVHSLTNELSDPIYRPQLIFNLSRIRTHREAAIPFLVQCLRDPDPRIREAALRGLARFGADAASAEPDIRTLLADPDPDVATRAKVAVEAIASERGGEP